MNNINVYVSGSSGGFTLESKQNGSYIVPEYNTKYHIWHVQVDKVS